MANPNPNPNLSFILIIFFFFTAMASPSSPSLSCNSVPVKHSSPLVSFLETLQFSALQTLGPSHFDPKLYVDLPLRFNLSSTQQAFEKLPRSSNGSISSRDLERFIGEYLGDAGSDLVDVEPVDFVAEPGGFLENVENPVVRKFALEVHSLWKNLSRKVSDNVKEKPELHTLIPLDRPVMVPGSRFREVYYWDSYWVIRGLLASKMYETAKDIVDNLISLIHRYGHVLNGARVYYSNRRKKVVGRGKKGRLFLLKLLIHTQAEHTASQPPLLSSMVMDIYTRTGDLALVQRAFPSLLKEHQFWNSGIHKVTIQDTQGCSHSVSRYYAKWNKPRPESSTTDEESATSLSNDSEKEHFYRELASAAESGWDFSSRWMGDSSRLTTLSTTSIIPVDLNAYILKMELDIAFFAGILGETSTAKRFVAASEARRAAIDTIFWNDEMGQWLDYWIVGNTTCEKTHRWKADNQNRNIFASNFIPLWMQVLSSGDAVEKVAGSLRTSGLLQPAGISTSLSNSGQQWDFPNGWAPLQHMIIEGLAKSGSREAKSMAEDIAVRWIRTNYAAFKKTGFMHEKYDVEACGKVGGGGEYAPQTGFGWSNGVLLAFLEEFGWPLDREIECPGDLFP